jgi:hypothetical protein
MADPQAKPKRGCLFFLCLVGAVSLIVLAVGAFLGVRYAKGLVGQLTDTQPMQLPTVKLPEAQMFELHDRVATFREEVRDGETAAPLELSADELNALIETDPALATLKNHLFVSIDGDQLRAKISFRAEDLGLIRLQGRYINADGVFDVGLTNQELRITAESLTVRGEPVPRHIMREVTAENLADRFNQDPKAAAGVKKLQAIQVKDGKLVIVPKK